MSTKYIVRTKSIHKTIIGKIFKIFAEYISKYISIIQKVMIERNRMKSKEEF